MKYLFSTVLIICFLAGTGFGQELSVPYMMRAPENMTIDGNLDEWSFAYPVTHSQASIPDSNRCRADGWISEDDDDCSGTLYMMYDEDYLYFAASVRDDQPGNMSESAWAGDAIEIYFGNWDIGDAYIAENVGMIDDAVSGMYATQVSAQFDRDADTISVYAYGLVNAELFTTDIGGTFAAYQIWENEDGYNFEVRVALPDLDSPTTGNAFEFEPGMRIPMTWSLYDVEDDKTSAGWDGLVFTPKGYAAWQGAGPGWQCCDVLGPATPDGDAWNMMTDMSFAPPFLKKAYHDVVIDGSFDEWPFAYRLNHKVSVIPDSGRCIADGWISEDDDDCSGEIYMMYDEDYLYFGGMIRDDQPGNMSESAWAGDAIEIYFGNWDIGDAYFDPDTNGMIDDAVSGMYATQVSAQFDRDADTISVYAYGLVNSELFTTDEGGSTAAYEIWENEDGYNFEIRVALPDLDSPTTGNAFEFVPGTRIPMSWSLYDVEDDKTSAGWDGLVYTLKGFAAWQGAGPGWQFADVKDVALIEYLDEFYREGALSVETAGINTLVPDAYALSQNYPNPFNPSTKIRFTLTKSSKVTLNIYSVTGQLVKTVIDNELRNAGAHEVSIDMSNYSSGVYFAVINNGVQSLQRKMVLLK